MEEWGWNLSRLLIRQIPFPPCCTNPLFPANLLPIMLWSLCTHCIFQYTGWNIVNLMILRFIIIAFWSFTFFSFIRVNWSHGGNNIKNTKKSCHQAAADEMLGVYLLFGFWVLGFESHPAVLRGSSLLFVQKSLLAVKCLTAGCAIALNSPLPRSLP